MKKIIYTMIMLLVITVGAYAVPQYINYQGILRDIPGNLQNGTFAMTFKIYNAETGGIALYDPLPTQVTVSNGLYNVRLGPVNSANIFDDNDNKWLEVTVGSDTLSPRLRINSVAYALRADVAGTAISANYATLSGTATNAATVNNIGASTIPVADKLYPLDSSGTLSGIPISVTASGTNNALYINGGKIGINPSTGIFGTATILANNPSVVVTNSMVSSSSIIFLTPKYTWGGPSIKVIPPIQTGVSFTVGTTDNSNVGVGRTLDFDYLIVN